ncbi:hypothetical protein C8Q74DRAFT_638193 [Fomes fomentarius]|nr:hypothetical protein C8Q74DRAFT_638193 [Fomes fomentarius]
MVRRQRPTEADAHACLGHMLPGATQPSGRIPVLPDQEEITRMPESSENIIPVLPTPVVHAPCAPPLSTTSQPPYRPPSPLILTCKAQLDADEHVGPSVLSAGAECVSSATGMPLMRRLRETSIKTGL